MSLIDQAREQMAKTVENTKENFSGIRTGRANPALLNGITVDYYGGKVAVRNIRRKTKEALDKAVKDGEMGEDEGDRLLKDLDKVTKSVTDEIDALLESKQKEIMEV